MLLLSMILGLHYYIVKYYQDQDWAAPYRRLEDRRSEARFPRIKKAPGSLLLRLVDFFYSSKTVENTFLPLVADWRNEYFEALMKGRKWKAQWISISYRYSFIQMMGSGIISAIIKILKARGLA
jgi:hypothetical protein